ncbi:MAG: ABC transporter ATP-binding protein, partial [Pirellulales bacterium]
MQNFARALKLALRHRWSFLGSLTCALMVAILWGGNISAVYPFVEVIFKGQSLQEWATAEIERSDDQAREFRGRVDQIQGWQSLDDGQLSAAMVADRNTVRLELAAAERAKNGTSASRQLVEGLRRRETEAQWLAQQPADVQREKLASELRLAETRLASEERAAGWYRRVLPYAQRYLPTEPFATLVWVLGLLMLGTLLKCGFMIGNSMLASRLALLVTFNLRTDFYRRTLQMDMATFNNDGVGELMSRFTYDMESVAEGMNSLFGKAIREPLKMIACLIGAAFVCWRLLVLSLIIVPLAAYVIDRLARLLKRANRRAMEEMSQIYSILEQTLQGIKVVKAFTMERAERRRFHQISKQFFHKSMRIVRYESLGRPTIEFMGILTICLALLAGAYLVLKGETHLLGIRMCDRPLSLGSLLMFYGLLAGTSDPARKLSEIFNRLQRAAAASDRIYAMLDREPSVREAVNPLRLPRHHKTLTLEKVGFRYRPSIPVLEDINLRIPFGETIALVGPNGCGKSTLLNLIPRFFDPSAGKVTLDGTDLRDIRMKDLRQQIGLVTQETLLFDDTVLNNIRYGTPRATREQVEQAAEQAKAHRFILDKLSDGYESLVGPRGNLLSGG